MAASRAARAAWRARADRVDAIASEGRVVRHRGLGRRVDFDGAELVVHDAAACDPASCVVDKREAGAARLRDEALLEARPRRPARDVDRPDDVAVRNQVPNVQ